MILIISCECDALFFGQRDVDQVGQQHQTGEQRPRLGGCPLVQNQS